MKRRILLGVGGLVVLALLAIAVYIGMLVRSGRPQRAGAATLPGLQAQVSVRYDRWGTPAIDAESGTDLAAALGWVHANDRMFQMELGRRAVAGRLSEVFGARALDFDRRSRRLGLRKRAEALAAAAGEETRGWLDAYALGVNAWLEARRSDLPPELRLLGVEPEPWKPADSISFIFLMARNLSPIDEPDELEAFRLLGAFGPDRARELVGRPGATIFDEVAAAARELGSQRQPLADHAEGGDLGSNNWAVGASRTGSQRALVANDPHLALGLPPLWFSARLHSPDYDASGVTLPGAPGVVLGRGPKVAWAFTNLYVDDLDVFVEQLDDSGRKVRRGDQWVDLAIDRQTIRVRGAADVSLDVASSERGPLLPAEPTRGLPPRSLTWTGSAEADQLGAFLRLARADSVRDVPAAIESYVFPAQNLVAGDDAGSILWTPIGRAPRRENFDGRFPAPGWKTEVRWDGLVPASANPVLIDPPGGVIATANSFLPVAQPRWFEGVFDTPYRADRVREVLRGRSGWNAEALARVQVDTVSLWAQELSRELAASFSEPPTGDAGKALALLAPWSGAMTSGTQDSAAAALFVLVERHLQRDIFEDEATRAGLARFGTRWRLHRLLRGELSPEYFDDVTTPDVEDREAIVRRALADAWAEAARRFGGEGTTQWSYARLRSITFNHPLGSLPVVGRFLERGPYEVDGSQTTILAFGGPWQTGGAQGDRIDVTYGPSMRLIQDAGDPDGSLLVQPTGQSGHPFDAHYDDQIPLFLEGRTRSFPWSDDRIEAATVSRLTLAPR